MQYKFLDCVCFLGEVRRIIPDATDLEIEKRVHTKCNSRKLCRRKLVAVTHTIIFFLTFNNHSWKSRLVPIIENVAKGSTMFFLNRKSTEPFPFLKIYELIV